MHFLVKPSTVRDVTLTVPGDKSVSHRAVMLGSIAEGQTRISGFLAGDDCLATMRAFGAMGVDIEQPSATELLVHGAGPDGLRAPADVLDLGNSGTAMRLMAGLMAGQAFGTTLAGDDSLNGRPMRRVIKPLEAMGASITSDGGTPPLTIQGGCELHGIDYELPVASAQVKSAILLAGLYAHGTVAVSEPAVTRDHTERMLRTMGIGIETKRGRTEMTGGQTLRGCTINVPADLSSAAFPMLATLLAENAEVLIQNVGVNPTRGGVIDILQAMGAEIALENPQLLGEEPVADIRVRSSGLRGIAVDPRLVSLAIDEFPVLFVAAAAADGKTVFSGLGELRVKESDRITAMTSGLTALGIMVEETEDGAIVTGGQFSGGDVQSCGDHRIAMAFAVAGTVASGPVRIHDIANVNTSFPGFEQCLRALGGEIASHEDEAA